MLLWGCDYLISGRLRGLKGWRMRQRRWQDVKMCGCSSSFWEKYRYSSSVSACVHFYLMLAAWCKHWYMLRHCAQINAVLTLWWKFKFKAWAQKHIKSLEVDIKCKDTGGRERSVEIWKPWEGAGRRSSKETSLQCLSVEEDWFKCVSLTEVEVM